MTPLRRPGVRAAGATRRSHAGPVVHRCIALFLTGLLTPSGVLWTQEERIPPPFIEREKVRFVTLDLVAREKRDGGWQALRGLHVADVRVLVAGREMTLEQFEDHCGGEVAPGPPAATPGRAGRPAVPQPGSMGAAAGRYILYIDLSWIDQRGLSMATKAAKAWAARLDPDARVMIVLSENWLRVLRPFRPASNGLAEDLDAALQEAMSSYLWSSWGAARSSEIRGQSSVRSKMIGPSPAAHASAVEAERRTKQAWRHLDDVMTLFTGLEGTKNLVFFSQELAFYSGHQGMVRGLTESAKKRDVRIYAGDPTGGRPGDALRFLAEETGGRSAHGAGGLFRALEEDLSCFYRVGFHLPPGDEGATGTIRVEIEGRRDVRIRHKQSLSRPSPQEEARGRLLAAMIAPESARGLPVSVTATALAPGPRGRARIEIRVPLRAFVDLPGGNERMRQIRLQAGVTLVPVVDEGEGHRRGVPLSGGGRVAGTPWSFAEGAMLRLPAGRDPAGRPRQVLLSREVALPPGRYRVIAVAEDSFLGQVGAATGDLVIPEEAPPLGPIRLAVRDLDALLIAEGPEGGDEERGDGRFRRLEATFPRQAVTLPAQALQAGADGWAVYAICEADPMEGEEPFRGWRLRRTLACGTEGRPARLPPVSPPSPEGDEVCALVIDPLSALELPPGPCRLRIVLERPGEAAIERRLEFTVHRSPPGGD